MSAPTEDTNAALWVFPMDFPIKIMGTRVDDFAQQICALVTEHAPDFDPASMELRASSKGNYLSLTATVRASSKQQLDDLYRALSAHPLVKVVL
jgi:uncharacterized protein